MTVINSIREVVHMPVQGISNSSQPIISFNYGAGEPERVKKAIRYMSFALLIYTVSAWILVMLFSKPRIKRLCSYLITLAAIIFIMTVVLIVLIPQIGKTIAEIIKVIPVAAAQLQQWAVGKLVEFPEIEEYIKGN